MKKIMKVLCFFGVHFDKLMFSRKVTGWFSSKKVDAHVWVCRFCGRQDGEEIVTETLTF